MNYIDPYRADGNKREIVYSRSTKLSAPPTDDGEELVIMAENILCNSFDTDMFVTSKMFIKHKPGKIRILFSTLRRKYGYLFAGMAKTR